MLEDARDQLSQDRRQHRRFCAFGQWVRTLPAEDRETAEHLVAGSDYNCRALARYFQSKGAKVNDQVLNRHRNKACCGQS